MNIYPDMWRKTVEVGWVLDVTHAVVSSSLTSTCQPKNTRSLDIFGIFYNNELVSCLDKFNSVLPIPLIPLTSTAILQSMVSEHGLLWPAFWEIRMLLGKVASR